MPHDYFDEPVAAVYDARSAAMFGPDVLHPAVEFLADLAGDGAALELGVGTGRVALALSRRGVPVHGVDLSPAMLRRLRAKPGGDAIPVIVGDFATVKAGRTFRLAYLVYNTICNLTTQDEQVACFVNVARHLEPGGLFVVEVLVPDLQRLPPGEVFHVFHTSTDHVGVDEYDVVTQQLVSHHYHVEGDRCEVSSIPFRYVWPSELDLMARIAGMRLRERWGDWQRSPFTAESTSHVSVWAKPG